MTQPTKAIAPILLEDYRKITVEHKGETNFFTSAMIKNCMKKVVTIDLHQTIQVDEDIEIKAYYAGHVLGAAMFHVTTRYCAAEPPPRPRLAALLATMIVLLIRRAHLAEHCVKASCPSCAAMRITASPRRVLPRCATPCGNR